MKTTKTIVFTSLFAALICVATMIIKIPTSLNGYVNLGDGILLLSAWILPLPYGILAAGFGSALADFFAGYAVYIPATFVIKGLMSVVAYLCVKAFAKRINGTASRIFAAVLAELCMIGGYFLFEGAIYGFLPSLANIPANALQAVAGVIVGVGLYAFLDKQNVIKHFK